MKGLAELTAENDALVAAGRRKRALGLTTKCQHLAMTGDRCRAEAVKTINVFEDPSVSRRWFRVHVCAKHARKP